MTGMIGLDLDDLAVDRGARWRRSRRPQSGYRGKQGTSRSVAADGDDTGRT